MAVGIGVAGVTVAPFCVGITFAVGVGGTAVAVARGVEVAVGDGAAGVGFTATGGGRCRSWHGGWLHRSVVRALARGENEKCDQRDRGQTQKNASTANPAPDTSHKLHRSTQRVAPA